MNKKIMIITDSCSDIRDEEIKELDVCVVPMQIDFNGEMYQEGIDISVEEFYDKLVASKVFPKTSQPSPEAFEKYYLQAKEEGRDVLVLTISSGLSGTVQSANIAIELADYEGHVTVIDTLNCLTAERLIVRTACKLRDEGKTIEEIAEVINDIKHRIKIFGIVDTLEYFFKGGRLSRAAMIIGSLIQLKPFIKLDEAGKITKFGQAIGLSRAIKAACEDIKKNPIDEDYELCYGYTMGHENIDRLIAQTQPLLNSKDYTKSRISAAAGSHIGPGGLCIAYVMKRGGNK